MQHLSGNGKAHGLQRATLGFRCVGQQTLGLAPSLLAQRLNPAAQRHHHRCRIQIRQPALKTLHLPRDHFPALFRLAAAIGQIFRDNFPQIVNIVQIHLRQHPDTRLHVARHRHIHHKQRTAAALRKNLFNVPRPDNGMGRGGAAHHDIGHGQFVKKRIKGEDARLKIFGQHTCTSGRGPIHNADVARSVREEMPRRQFARLARTDHQHPPAFQRAEDPADQFHRRKRHRYRFPRNGGFAAHPLGGSEGTLQQPLQNQPAGAFGVRLGIGALDLPQDLRFANHHGVQPGSDLEQVARGFDAAPAQQMRHQLVFRHLMIRGQEGAQAPGSRFLLPRHHRIDLDAVAGGKDQPLPHGGQRQQGTQRLSQPRRRKGHPLAQGHRRAAVVYANRCQLHRSSRLPPSFTKGKKP